MNTASNSTYTNSQAQVKFFALGESVRLSIVNKLAQGPATAGELAEPFEISRPAISRHLRVLRDAEIVCAEVQGREWWYTLNPNTFSWLQEYLEEVKQMWGTTLHAFKTYMEDEEK